MLGHAFDKPVKGQQTHEENWPKRQALRSFPVRLTAKEGKKTSTYYCLFNKTQRIDKTEESSGIGYNCHGGRVISWNRRVHGRWRQIQNAPKAFKASRTRGGRRPRLNVVPIHRRRELVSNSAQDWAVSRNAYWEAPRKQNEAFCNTESK